LANRVRELEAQLSSAKHAQGPDAMSPSSHGGSVSSPVQAFTHQPNTNTSNLSSEAAAESTADAIATGLFDDQPGNTDIGYFGKLASTRNRVQVTRQSLTFDNHQALAQTMHSFGL
jgi:hypothetical protein